MPELHADAQAGHPEHAAPLCARGPRGGAGGLIRSATPADAGFIADLYTRCFPDVWRAQDAAALLGETGVLALLSGEGFIVARSAADEAEILWVGVSPQARRLGLGAALLDACVSQLERLGLRRVCLEVSAANVAARALYARAGFEAVGLRPRYYSDLSDALILARALQPSLLSGQS